MAKQAVNDHLFRSVCIHADDGFPLALRHYPPSNGACGRAVIFLSATGAIQSRFGPYASFLAAKGWHAVTFDYRSIGESAVPEGGESLAVSMRAWGQKDLAAVIEWVSSHLGNPRIALISHSIGGQIAPLAANSDRVNAMLAVAVQKGYYRLWPGWRRHVVFSFFRFYIPFFLHIMNYVPLEWLGLNGLERGVAEDYARWTLRPDYRDDLDLPLHVAHENFCAPILSLSFEDDLIYAPRRTVDHLFERFYINAPILRAHIQPHDCGAAKLGHSGFFKPEQCPLGLWQESEAWLSHVLAGGSSESFKFSVLPAAPFPFSGEESAVLQSDFGITESVEK